MSNLGAYEISVIYFGSLFWGEEAVYFLSFLSGINVVNVFKVFLFSFLGSLTCGTFWFLIARFGFLSKIVDKVYSGGDINIFPNIIKDRRKRLFLILVLSKFFLGTRLVAIFYFAKKKTISSFRFILYNSLAVFIWISFVVWGLFLIGNSTSIVFSDVERAGFLLNVFIIFIIFIILFRKFLFPKIVEFFYKKVRT